jgi:tetratricopeptide (TPR) repeat protein
VGGDWLDLSGEESLSDLEMATFDLEVGEPEAFAAEPSDDIPDWLRAQMPVDLKQDVPEIESEEDLGWLDQIAAGEGAAIEELPTLSWDDVEEDADVGLEDGDLSWLDGMVEMDTFSEELEISDSLDLFAETTDDLSMDVPDDPDEAMAWLEQLAAQQGAPLDELPTLDKLPEIAGAKPSESPIDEVPADEFEMPEIDLEALTFIDIPEEMVLEVETEAAAEAGAFEVPDDLDEAMAWLEQLAAQQGAPLDELPTVHEAPALIKRTAEPKLQELEVQPDVEPEPIFEVEVDPDFEMALAELSDIEMPEDDDEALAWLEAFAGGDDFGSVDEPEAVVEETVAPGQSLELFDEQSLESAEDSLFADFEDGSDQFINLEDETLADMDQDFVDDELDASLPDWLSFEPMGETSSEELDWLDTFGESDIDSWLVAEEQVTQIDIPVPLDTGELEPLVFREFEPAVEEDFVLEPEEIFEPAPAASIAASGPMDRQQLESARSALEVGDYDDALDRYNALLNSGQGLSLLISDLETASTRYTNNAPLRRLLGDAYMRNGQLQKAIDTYRQALDQL